VRPEQYRAAPTCGPPPSRHRGDDRLPASMCRWAGIQWKMQPA